MTKNYRDALTGKWTTAADAAARPAETVAETVERRHEAPDVAELRRLLAAKAPGTWCATYGPREVPRIWPDDEGNYVDPLFVGNRSTSVEEAELVCAAVNALPGLLDRLAHMTEARDNARAEVERLTAVVERVRERHERESFWQYDRDQERSYLTQQDAADESGCDCPEDPESTYLAHTPECLTTITHFDVCSECARIEYADADRQAHGEFSGYAEALWPCPTIRALGGEQS